MTATTAVPHGLYQAIGNNSSWPISVTALNPAYNHPSSKSDCTITGPSTFTIRFRSIPGGNLLDHTHTASFRILLQTRQDQLGARTVILLSTSTPKGMYKPIFQVRRAFSLFGFITASMPLMARLCRWVTLEPVRSLTLRYTPLGDAPVMKTFVWAASQDRDNMQVVISNIDPAKPPRNIYIGLTDNLPAWDSGLYFEPAYENMLKAAAGVIRFMDWMQTNSAVGVTSFSKIALRRKFLVGLHTVIPSRLDPPECQSP